MEEGSSKFNTFVVGQWPLVNNCTFMSWCKDGGWEGEKANVVSLLFLLAGLRVFSRETEKKERIVIIVTIVILLIVIVVTIVTMVAMVTIVIIVIIVILLIVIVVTIVTMVAW